MSYEEDKILINNRKPLEFKIPEYYYVEYYKKLEQNSPLYAILSIGGGKSRVFFSPYNGSKSECVSYLFFREADAKMYLDVLKKTGLAGAKEAVMVKCDPKNIASSFRSLIEKESESEKFRVFHVISSIFLHGEFRDMECFWTNNKSKFN